MTPQPRIDRVFVATWTAILVALCVVGNAVAWLLQRLWERYGDAIMAHADAIVAVVLTVCGIALAVLAVAERAKKDNPSW